MARTTKRSLKEILDSVYVDNSEEEGTDDQIEKEGLETDNEERYVDPSVCMECEDMKYEIKCKDCDEKFCVICFEMLHRGGKRKLHEHLKVTTILETSDKSNMPDDEETQKKKQDLLNGALAANGIPDQTLPEENEELAQGSTDAKLMKSLYEKTRYIPLRLTYEERHLLRLLEAALHVSEYTDRVDILSYKSKAKRVVEQLKECCSVLTGLVVASDLKIGQKILEMKNFSDNAQWFQDIFEIGRRYKIMNPERMRDTYGKLCYMVMDSRLPQIKEHMEFDLYKPIKTVQSYLTSNSADEGRVLALFQDKLIIPATSYISAVGKPRLQINKLIKQKETAIEILASRYSTKFYTKEDIRQVLYSVGDYHAYVNMNRRPIMRMLERLEVFRNPEIASKFNIGIQYGRDGARLTHDHERQWHYVQQSLTLWSIIQREMVKLWYIADDDLYDGSNYKLASTGHGLHRIKACPGIYKEMHRIIQECRTKTEKWVGSSVVHLGDDAVPNALFFLDKYTQVPSILIPFDQTLIKINDMVKDDPYMLEYINREYGSVENLKLTILQDAFAHMFDGSGADNFYMSGSCIDGRLTSAWNHCNEIAKKKYYNMFLLTSFTGFNGSEGF